MAQREKRKQKSEQQSKEWSESIEIRRKAFRKRGTRGKWEVVEMAKKKTFFYFCENNGTSYLCRAANSFNSQSVCLGPTVAGVAPKTTFLFAAVFILFIPITLICCMSNNNM